MKTEPSGVKPMTQLGPSMQSGLSERRISLSVCIKPRRNSTSFVPRNPWKNPVSGTAIAEGGCAESGSGDSEFDVVVNCTNARTASILPLGFSAG